MLCCSVVGKVEQKPAIGCPVAEASSDGQQHCSPASASPAETQSQPQAQQLVASALTTIGSAPAETAPGVNVKAGQRTVQQQQQQQSSSAGAMAVTAAEPTLAVEGPALEWEGGGTGGVSGSDVADLFLEPVELQVASLSDVPSFALGQ